jgi:hypothetical protein
MKLLFVSLIVTLSFCCLSVQCNSVLKQVVKTEGQLIDDVARNGDDIANGAKNNLDETIKSGSNTARNSVNSVFKKGIEKFKKGLLAFSEEALKEILEMSLEELEKEQFLLYQIETNTRYDSLKAAIAKKLNRPKVLTTEVRALLLGREIQGFKIDSNKLYFIYLKYSDRFLAEELNNLQVNNNCSDEIQTYVKQLAEKRKVKIYSCDKEEEVEEHSIVFDILALLILGGIGFAILIYLWKGLKNLFAKKNKN